jgi:hypothetical protein
MKSKATSPKEICWGSNHLLQQTKMKTKVNTLQEKCIVHEAIKI